MGLDAFNVAPDNKGGRKKKEETDDQGFSEERDPGYEHDALTIEKDTEEYWQDLFDRFVTGEEPNNEELVQLVAWTQTNPRTVKTKMYEYDIWTAEDIDDIMWEPPTKAEAILGKLGSGSSGSSDDDDNEPSSGLSSFMS